jgi:hypothetical protein
LTASNSPFASSAAQSAVSKLIFRGKTFFPPQVELDNVCIVVTTDFSWNASRIARYEKGVRRNQKIREEETRDALNQVQQEKQKKSASGASASSSMASWGRKLASMAGAGGGNSEKSGKAGGQAENEEESTVKLDEEDRGFIGGILQRVLDNLTVVVKNVHIRVEDRSARSAGGMRAGGSGSGGSGDFFGHASAGHESAWGIVLQEFSLKSVNEQGEPAQTKEDDAFMHKKVVVDGLSVYWDCGSVYGAVFCCCVVLRVLFLYSLYFVFCILYFSNAISSAGLPRSNRFPRPQTRRFP